MVIALTLLTTGALIHTTNNRVELHIVSTFIIEKWELVGTYASISGCYTRGKISLIYLLEDQGGEVKYTIVHLHR